MLEELEPGDLDLLRVSVLRADPLVRGGLAAMLAGSAVVVGDDALADAVVWDLGTDPDRAPPVRFRADRPAHAAGVHLGDVLLAVDGEPVSTNADLLGILGDGRAGADAILRLLRAGEVVEVPLTLGRAPVELPRARCHGRVHREAAGCCG